MTALVAVVVVASGAALLRWNDAFHLAVALPIVGGAALLVLWLARAGRDEEEVDVADPDDAEPLAVRALRGVLAGALLVAAGAGSVGVAARTPLYGWFYDRDVEKVIEHVQVLDRAGNFDEAVRLIDERSAASLSPDARVRLGMIKCRALVRSAEQRRSAERVARLREARACAEGLGNPDLQELVAAKLRADEKDDLLARVQLAVSETARGLVVTLPDVLFASGSDSLMDASGAQVRQIATLLNTPDHTARRISVEGHADATGNEGANRQLSASRAAAVAAALGAAGVDAGRVATKGLSSSEPVAPNETADGRAKNRRVEVVLLK